MSDTVSANVRSRSVVHMVSRVIPVDTFDLVIFGGTGDLAERKLIPALYQRQVAGQLSEPTRILGASRAQCAGAGGPERS